MDRNRLTCVACKTRPRKSQHFNCKLCKKCAKDRLTHPRPNLEEWQKKIIRDLDGKVDLFEIARRIGSSKPTVWRYRRDAGLTKRVGQYDPGLAREVCEFYAEHGKIATKKLFPEVNVRSIVERYLSRYGFPPRQVRWTGAQLTQLAKMNGLISLESQALYFNRPRAHAGSIKSAWVKKMHGTKTLHGLKGQNARHLVAGYVVWDAKRARNRLVMPIKPLELPWWTPRPGPRKRLCPRRLYLWVDIEKHLDPKLDRETKACVRAMAKFQRWLYGTKDVRHAILKMIQQREKANGRTGKERRNGRQKLRAVQYKVGHPDARRAHE